MIEYSLKLLDRVVIESLLPKQGDMPTLIIAEDVKNKVKLTQNEVTEFAITTTSSGNLSWKKEAGVLVFDIEFTEAESNLIKEQLTEMNKKKTLTSNHMNVYKLFVK